MGFLSTLFKKKGTEQAAETTITDSPQIEAGIDEEIIAIIGAVVFSWVGGDARICAIRRSIGGVAPVWSMAGRQDTMNLRRI